jgi:hypothetical protein
MAVESEPTRRRRGRPRIGDERIQLKMPRAAYEILLKIEDETEVPRTQVATNILCQHLIGSATKPKGRSIVRSHSTLAK